MLHPTALKSSLCTCRASSKPFKWPANSICSSDITSIIKDIDQSGAEGPEEEDLFYLCANYAPFNTGTISLNILSLFESIPEEYEGVQGSVQSSIKKYYESVAKWNGIPPFVYHYYSCEHPVISTAIHAKAGQWHRKRISPNESIHPLSSSNNCECPPSYG